MQRVAAFERGLLAVLAGGAACFLLAVVSCVLAQFVGRAALGAGLHWTGELARFAFVWCALLGAAAAWQAGALHRVDILQRRLRGGPHRLLEAVVLLLVLAACAYLLHHGVRLTQRVVGQTSSTMEISMAWVYAAMPVSAAAMIAATLLRLLRLVSTPGLATEIETETPGGAAG